MGNNPLLAEPPDTWRMNGVNSFENCPSINFFFVCWKCYCYLSSQPPGGASHLFIQVIEALNEMAFSPVKNFSFNSQEHIDHQE